MIRLVRTELRKLVTIRQPYGMVAAAAAITALVTVITASRAGGSGGDVPSLATVAGLTNVLTSTGAAMLLALAFGVTVATGEFHHGTASGTYLATPDRNRALVAKMLAAAVAGALIGVVASGIATGVGLAFVAARGYHLALSAGTITRFAAGAVLGSALLAAVGVGIGSLIRQQLGAIVAVFAWGFVIEQVVGGLFHSVQPYLPFTAATTMAGATLGGATALPFAASALLVTGVAIAAGVLASMTTVRRDIV